MAASLSGIDRKVRRLESYSGLESAHRLVLRPATEDQVRAVFLYASEFGRRLTLHGGGHSFDAQALGDDLIVSLERLNRIDVLADGTVEVGPGATWGQIVRELKRRSMVPSITVTTEHATAAGTLAANCLSRFSPAYGKEGTHVVSFRLMTPDGVIHSCAPPAPALDRAAWDADQRLFMAAVGGFGYLGAFLTVRFRAVERVPTPIRVKTTPQVFTDFRDLEEDLRREATAVANRGDPADPRLPDAIYAAVSAFGDRQQAVKFRSSFTTDDGTPLILFRPEWVLRPIAEWLMRNQSCNRLIWDYAFRQFAQRKTYVDELEGYTFFMDGNVRAKHWAGRLGLSLKTLQQTFIVPVGGEGLAEWLLHARGVLNRLGVAPTLQDVLYLPQDMPFYLSATPEGPGWAVSYAFDTSHPDELEDVTHAFVRLARELDKTYGGRVYLVKNVRADRATIEAMYGPDLAAFRAVKDEFDPQGILRNGFFDRVLAGPP
jgi:decaprenylphospho-beta-D-ribofuranose 2-oxidase